MQCFSLLIFGFVFEYVMGERLEVQEVLVTKFMYGVWFVLSCHSHKGVVAIRGVDWNLSPRSFYCSMHAVTLHLAVTRLHVLMVNSGEGQCADCMQAHCAKGSISILSTTCI